MINYMSDLMEDVTDYNWQNAKAAHAVLCCEFEHGTVSWEDTDRIDHIRRAHAQRHTISNSKSWSKVENANDIKPSRERLWLGEIQN